MPDVSVGLMALVLVLLGFGMNADEIADFLEEDPQVIHRAVELVTR